MRTDKVKIGYKTYRLIDTTDHIVHENTVCDGLINSDDQTITLNSKLTPENRLRVVLHELTHGVADLYNVELSEPEVDMLAIGWSALVKDNPDLIREILFLAEGGGSKPKEGRHKVIKDKLLSLTRPAERRE